MRERNTIEKQVQEEIIGPIQNADEKLDLVVLEVLLDIRELLIELNKEVK